MQAAGGCSQVGRRDDEEDGVSGQKTAAVFEGKEDGTAEVIAHLQSGNGVSVKGLNSFEMKDVNSFENPSEWTVLGKAVGCPISVWFMVHFHHYHICRCF